MPPRRPNCGALAGRRGLDEHQSPIRAGQTRDHGRFFNGLLTLRASHVTAAPIQAMALQLAGRFYSVEGAVDFTPKPDGRYVVRGELKAEGSSVWLEDEATGQPVTPKVSKK